MFRRGPTVRPLRPAALDGALRLALADPLTTTLPGSRLAELRVNPGMLAREFSVLGGDAAPQAVLWGGANAGPVGGAGEELDILARSLASRRRTSSSLVGPRAAIERMWPVIAPAWGRAREERWSQPLLEAVDAPAVVPEPTLRSARPGEEDAVFPAAVAMFREEVGSDPTAYDGGAGYHRRVAALIREGRTYVVTDRAGEVLFKADVGARLGDVAQLHGVWVRPDQRGRGLARRAMAAVVEKVRRDHAGRVSLYVNDFNEPARRAYAAAGFRQAGELTTLLF